jgi:peptidyl-prolyl cis-trans isomerase C
LLSYNKYSREHRFKNYYKNYCRIALLKQKRIFMAYATARHILVASEDECNTLKAEIENGASFESVAQAHSQCPSGAQGGDLGQFGPGQMVPEFDKAVFTGDVGVLYGPIQTQFGYHLLEVTSRG